MNLLSFKKKILIISGSRSDYSLLKPLILNLRKDSSLITKLVITGSHLEKKFGLTIQEIKKDKIKINYKIYINAVGSSLIDISKSFNSLLNKASSLLKKTKPDGIIVLGDRHEIFAFTLASFLQNIKIFHFAGGEETPNNYDGIYRDLISKVSSIHFVTNKIYKENLKKKGIDGNKIFNVGSLGIENIRSVRKIDIKKIFLKLNLKYSNNYFLVTFHPTTNLSKKHNVSLLSNLLNVLSKFSKYNMVFTYPGSDIYNDIIIKKINNFCRKNQNARFIKSLGNERYINLAKKCDLVIGNSSSGISEIPTLKRITINIGLRQRGRIFSNSVIDAGVTENSIQSAIKRGLKLSQNKSFCSKIFNPYGNGFTTNRAIKIIKRFI